MHPLIEKLLFRKGIADLKDLDDTPMPDGSPTEKQKFEEWNATLSKEELTVDDIKDFCRAQIAMIDGKWADLNTTNEKKAELIPYHTVYRLFLLAIDSPRSARENLEKQLNQLIK